MDYLCACVKKIFRKFFQGKLKSSLKVKCSEMKLFLKIKFGYMSLQSLKMCLKYFILDEIVTATTIITF